MILVHNLLVLSEIVHWCTPSISSDSISMSWNTNPLIESILVELAFQSRKNLISILDWESNMFSRCINFGCRAPKRDTFLCLQIDWIIEWICRGGINRSRTGCCTGWVRWIYHGWIWSRSKLKGFCTIRLKFAKLSNGWISKLSMKYNWAFRVCRIHKSGENNDWSLIRFRYREIHCVAASAIEAWVW